MNGHGLESLLTLAIIALPARAQGHSSRFKDLNPVIVYLRQDYASLTEDDVATAEIQANRMFVAAGIRIVWRHRAPSTTEIEREHAIVLRVTLDTPPSELRHALALARPYEGVHIRVFYDRIRLVRPNGTPTILAHVFVHEITHIVQGINRHSEIGVMKERWSEQDFDEMIRRSLPFAPSDIDLIRKGLARP